ncbi:MAG: XdhC family protein [Bacteroidota bacterium]|nr:XdhC family protein [Bacteroidota bacterium]
MKEIREIIKAYDAATKAGKKSALAAVVHLNGSSYRRPGARMLVTDEGELTGAISGGCLEGDALRKAMLVLSQQKSRLVTYDTNDEDDATIGVQLGCAGIIQVLFEPINVNDHNNPTQLLRKAIAVRQQAVLITLFSLEDKKNEQAGTCMLIEKNGNISGDIPFPGLKKNIMEDAALVMQAQTSSFKNYQTENIGLTAFIEFLQPPVSLTIAGAGNDAIPMMQMADILGWDVRIIDGRGTHARPERFVSACQVLVSKPEKVLEQIPSDERTAFVLMTHNYNYDLAMLKALIFYDVLYIGLLGPKLKLKRMLAEMKEQGIEINEQQLQKIYGPVGLEIGAETAEEIAVSIIGEIQAVISGTSGGLLRDKQGVIHSRNEKPVV